MLRRWPLSLVVLTLVASAALQLWRLARVSDEAELAAAAAIVRREFRAGDLIVVEPPWMVGPRRLLGDLPLIEPRRIAPDDLLGVDRVWLLQLASIGGDLGVGTALAGLGTTVSTRETSRVHLRLVDLTANGRIVFDLRAGLEAASVIARYPDGVEARCERFELDRWVCPRDPGWNYVGRETLDIDGQPRACVWLHPIAAGGTLTVELPALPALVGARLEGAFGFTSDAAQRAAAPVKVSVRRGEVVLAERSFPVEPGWRRWRVPIPAGSGRLAVVLSSANNGAAHFCGELRVVEEEG
jgi:hypothetical protein